jgi:hypothetical protein
MPLHGHLAQYSTIITTDYTNVCDTAVPKRNGWLASNMHTSLNRDRFATPKTTTDHVRFSQSARRLILACAWVGCVFAPSAAFTHPSGDLDQYIQITAGIDVTSSRPDATNANRTVNKTWHYTAVCTIGANCWRIDDDASANAEASFLCDMTNVYKLIRITKRLPSFPPSGAALAHKLGLDREPSAEVYSRRYIEISPGELPLADVGADLPWLAFCSGHYLKEKDRVLPLLFTSIRITADAFAYVDRTSCFDDSLGLPKSVDWYFSTARFAKGLNDPRLSRGDYMMKMRSILQRGASDGALRSRYTVHEWTNWSGLHIPTKFELLECGMGGVWNSQRWSKAVGQVASIRRAAEPKAVLLESTNQIVNDYRFRSAGKLLDFIHYEWPSHVVPSTNDPSLVALCKRKEAQAAADPRLITHRWRIVLTLIILIGPAFFAMYWYWRRRFGPTSI